MKKMFLALAVCFSTLGAFAGETVNKKVLDAFHSAFATASEVSWTTGDNYAKATFSYNGKYVFAYYSNEGELLALTRYISPADLPLTLQNNLKKNYEGYWVSDLFEASKNDGTSYYATLENADTKIVLNASGGRWTVYTKTKKS